DIGTGKGNSRRSLERKFGCRGIGVELRFNKAQLAKKYGYPIVIADVTLPIVKPKSVKFSNINHVLEHLPNLESVKQLLQEVSLATTDSIYIKGPWFDADDYLKERGLNLFWSTWPGHPTHLTTTDLVGVLKNLGLNSFTIGGKGPLIYDSMNPRIHPVGYEAGHNYTRGNYPPKKYIQFDIPIFNELVCEVNLQ
ncbi:MAG: methyltransferase domain-containing protein, partial [Candidatus Thorarchaeota archaeon]